MALATMPLGNDQTTDPDSWLERYGNYLFHFALKRLRDADAAEDMVQETFLAGLKARHSFSGRSTEKTWLAGILKHKIVDYIRKAMRERPIGTMHEESDKIEERLLEKDPLKAVHARNTNAPRKVLEEKEFLSALRESLAEISPRLAEAFVRREIEDMKSDEICKAMGVSATNLWVMLHRARISLRERLASRLAV